MCLKFKVEIELCEIYNNDKRVLFFIILIVLMSFLSYCFDDDVYTRPSSFKVLHACR